MSKVKEKKPPMLSGFCSGGVLHDRCRLEGCPCSCHIYEGDPMDPLGQEIERLCVVLHDAYEAAAAQVGWETQVRSRVSWPDVPEANKATMRIAVRALLEAL